MEFIGLLGIQAILGGCSGQLGHNLYSVIRFALLGFKQRQLLSLRQGQQVSHSAKIEREHLLAPFPQLFLKTREQNPFGHFTFPGHHYIVPLHYLTPSATPIKIKRVYTLYIEAFFLVMNLNTISDVF